MDGSGRLGEVWSGTAGQGKFGNGSLRSGVARYANAFQHRFNGEFLVGVSVRFQDFADHRLAGNQDRNVVGPAVDAVMAREIGPG